MIIVLSGERPVSWNTLYKSGHWYYRQMLALDIHQKVAYALHAMGITKQKPQIFEGKVDIKVLVYSKGRPIDSDNVIIKLYCDGLKGLVLHDDSPKYVNWTASKSLKCPPDQKERIEIIIEPAID